MSTGFKQIFGPSRLAVPGTRGFRSFLGFGPLRFCVPGQPASDTGSGHAKRFDDNMFLKSRAERARARRQQAALMAALFAVMEEDE